MNIISRLADYVDEQKYPRNYHVFLLCIYVLIASGALVASASPQQVMVGNIQMPPLCPFKLLTGWDCPGCGITRALILAFHGEWMQSLGVHFWGIPLALVILIQVPYRIYRIQGGRPFEASSPVKAWSYRLVLLSLIVPWAIRMVLVLSAQ